MFPVLAALCALSAMGFALAPFLRRAYRDWRSTADRKGTPASELTRRGKAGTPVPSGPGRANALRALYRQRLLELEDETVTGILDESNRLEVEQELGFGLLDEFASAGGASDARGGGERSVEIPESDRPAARTEIPATSSESGIAGAADGESGDRQRVTDPLVWVLTGAVLPLFAFLLYSHVGEPDAGVLSQAPRLLELHPERDRLELDRWRVWLADRLDREPDDSQTRYLLGRIYLKDGEYGRAAESFALTHAAVGDDPGLDLVWLQALYLGNSGRLDALGRRVAERILARDPGNPMVLEMLAVDTYRQGSYRESVGFFTRALASAVDPGQILALDVFLNQARSMLGNLTPSIDVELEALAPPPNSATLFVIARPAGGGMPYAVVRRTAARLPDVVRLDDAVSMNPALPLSAAGEIEVIVRISMTGAAVRHPGDWEWRSEPISVAGVRGMRLVAEIGPP